MGPSCEVCDHYRDMALPIYRPSILHANEYMRRYTVPRWFRHSTCPMHGLIGCVMASAVGHACRYIPPCVSWRYIRHLYLTECHGIVRMWQHGVLGPIWSLEKHQNEIRRVLARNRDRAQDIESHETFLVGSRINAEIFPSKGTSFVNIDDSLTIFGSYPVIGSIVVHSRRV